MKENNNAAEKSPERAPKTTAAEKQIKRQSADLKRGQYKTKAEDFNGQVSLRSCKAASKGQGGSTREKAPFAEQASVSPSIGVSVKDDKIFFNGNQPIGDKERGKRLTELAARLLEDDAFIAAYVVGNAKVENAVIERYLKGKLKAAPVMGRGSAALTPIAKPKTLEEAGRLCRLYLNDL